MKKIIAMLLVVLTVFSMTSVAVFAAADEPAGQEAVAEDPVAEEPADDSDEPTTRNIVNKDGLVVPINFEQLKQSFVFKIIEKVINLILSVFGTSLDDFLTDTVKGGGDFLDEALSNIEGSLNN